MSKVLLGMGSNINPEQHLKDAANTLKKRFPDIQFSHVYQSAAVGMDGDDFLNACCVFQHDLPQAVLLVWLKSLEDKHGRDRSEGSWKPRTLDLDVLMVDEQLLDENLYKYGHIYIPASELVSCKPIEQNKFDSLEQVELKLNGLIRS